MTLCAVWADDRNEEQRVILACDSLITGGFRYEFGTKLTVFSRADCALCWEGSTSYTYSFAMHAKSDIDWSDNLITKRTDIDSVLQRIKTVFNEMWMAVLADTSSRCKEEEFSFLFAGYSSRRKKPMAWHLTRKDRSIIADQLDLSTPTYIGSGASKAQNIQSQGLNNPYSVLLKVIESKAVEDVGGAPQAFEMGEHGGTAIGFLKGNERFLFGRKISSSGHNDRIRYISCAEEI